MKKHIIGAAVALGTLISTVSMSFAEELLVPHLTYRVGPFALTGLWALTLLLITSQCLMKEMVE